MNSPLKAWLHLLWCLILWDPNEFGYSIAYLDRSDFCMIWYYFDPLSQSIQCGFDTYSHYNIYIHCWILEIAKTPIFLGFLHTLWSTIAVYFSSRILRHHFTYFSHFSTPLRPLIILHWIFFVNPSSNPYPRIHSASLSYSVLFPHSSLYNVPSCIFGCVYFVQVLGLGHDKLSSRDPKCVFLGCSHTQKGYECYDPISWAFFVSAGITLHTFLMMGVLLYNYLLTSSLESPSVHSVPLLIVVDSVFPLVSHFNKPF